MSSADLIVADIAPAVAPPVVRRRDAVLVTGPWLAGTSSIVDGLRELLGDIEFVESDELAPGEAPLAVIFVVSAAARLTSSDAVRLDAAAAHTDLVIGVVSKIDVHRNWRDTLAENHIALTEHRDRYSAIPWVGVAAAPDVGDRRLDGLAHVLANRLSCQLLDERNVLRSWESHLTANANEFESAAAGSARHARTSALRARRGEVLSQQRNDRSERTSALRAQLQQARVQLSYFAASRCASVRAELQDDAAALTRRSVPGFPDYVAHRSAVVVAEVNDWVTRQLTCVADELGLPPPLVPPAAPPPPGVPPLRSRQLETRLMVLLGTGFGLGVAVALSRLFANLGPGLAVVAPVLCAVVGIGLTLWVVRTRSLLHDRAVLDRWVADVVSGLRPAVDRDVATRIVAADEMWTAVLADQEQSNAARFGEQIRIIDTELREHALAGAHAIADHDREVPVLNRALAAVRAELSLTMEGIRHREECGCSR